MSLADLLPTPLYQSFLLRSKKICFACGKDVATSVLRTVSVDMVPLCETCGKDWNFHGYYILMRVKPKQLIKNILKYKLLHWFKSQSVVSLCRDLKQYSQWVKTQRKFLK